MLSIGDQTFCDIRICCNWDSGNPRSTPNSSRRASGSYSIRALQVIHHNRYSAREFIAQRFAHGHEFGLTRARMQSFLKRLLLVVLAPGIPFILMTRIVRASRRKPELRKQLKGAWIWLAIFTLAWAAGEASATLRAYDIDSLLSDRNKGLFAAN